MTSDSSVLVSPDNFARAESDLYFGNLVHRTASARSFISAS